MKRVKVFGDGFRERLKNFWSKHKVGSYLYIISLAIHIVIAIYTKFPFWYSCGLCFTSAILFCVAIFMTGGVKIPDSPSELGLCICLSIIGGTTLIKWTDEFWDKCFDLMRNLNYTDVERAQLYLATLTTNGKLIALHVTVILHIIPLVIIAGALFEMIGVTYTKVLHKD